jgi:hypothetical protein
MAVMEGDLSAHRSDLNVMIERQTKCEATHLVPRERKGAMTLVTALLYRSQSLRNDAALQPTKQKLLVLDIFSRQTPGIYNIRQIRMTQMISRTQIPRSKKFSTWRLEVDRLLNSEYAITIVDAGIDDTVLRKHWETQVRAAEFVEWFGTKYDLTPVAKWNWGFRARR